MDKKTEQLNNIIRNKNNQIQRLHNSIENLQNNTEKTIGKQLNKIGKLLLAGITPHTNTAILANLEKKNAYIRHKYIFAPVPCRASIRSEQRFACTLLRLLYRFSGFYFAYGGNSSTTVGLPSPSSHPQQVLVHCAPPFPAPEEPQLVVFIFIFTPFVALVLFSVYFASFLPASFPFPSVYCYVLSPSLFRFVFTFCSLLLALYLIPVHII